METQFNAVFDKVCERLPRFLEVRVGRGTRKDLGRPTHTPADAKDRFMQYLAAR